MFEEVRSEPAKDAVTPNRIAVAIMAKAPIPGEAKTRLIPALGAEHAARLQKAMLLDTVDLVGAALGREAAISIVCPSVLHQQLLQVIMPLSVHVIAHRGADLMEGLDYALTHHLAEGFEYVILLDGDSPTLPTSSLAAALRHLAEHDLVLGPTLDGGYYLLGACRPQPSLFRWVQLSDAVCEQTRRRAEAEGMSVKLLPPWYDVDTAADLDRLLAELRSHARGAPRVRALLKLEASA